MNAIKCPNCGRLGATSENFCLNCGSSLSKVSSSAYVSVSPLEHARVVGFGNQQMQGVPVDSETGRNTWKWFRVYCGFMTFIYVLVVGLGVLMLGLSTQARAREANEMFLMGIIYTILGLIFAIPFAVAPFLKRKPGVWVYCLVLIVIGLMGCPTIFASVPLLIYWIKPETKAFFGRT